MASCVDYMVVILCGLLIALACFFRCSLAPITDVLELEFNSTSGQVGLMASFFWLGYCIFQIPVGLLQTKVNEEKILMCSSFIFSVTCFAFGIVKSESIILPSIFMFVSGVCMTPMVLCFMSIVPKRFSNDHLASFGGIMFGSNAAVVVTGNMLQAYLYQNFEIWRPVYWVIASMTFIICTLLITLNFDQMCTKKVKIEEAKVTKCNSISTDADNETGSTPSPEEGGKTKTIQEKDDKSTLTFSTVQKFKLVICNPFNWVLAIHLFAVNAIQFAFNGLWLINYMRMKYGIDRQMSTMISGTFWISYAISLFIVGRICFVYKKRKIIYYFTMFLLFVPPSIVIYGDENMPLIVIYSCNVISGCGMGVLALVFVVVREYNDENGCSDIAAGFVNCIGITSGFIMQYLIGLLMDYHWEQRGGVVLGESGRIYDVSDYNCGFHVITFVGGLGIITSMLVKETNGKPVQWGK